MKNVVDIYKNLPPQLGNKVCKRLFPSIHFYYSYASYNFIHGSDPDICERCSLTPKGTDVRDEPWRPLPTSLISRGHCRDQGSNESLQLFCTENRGRSYSKHKWGKTSTRKSTIHSSSRSNLGGLAIPAEEDGRNESDTTCLLKEVMVGMGRKKSTQFSQQV